MGLKCKGIPGTGTVPYGYKWSGSYAQKVRFSSTRQVAGCGSAPPHRLAATYKHAELFDLAPQRRIEQAQTFESIDGESNGEFEEFQPW